MNSNIVCAFCVLVTVVGSAVATVDPANATYFHPIPGNAIAFNITHKQWRESMVHGERSIPFWVNPYQMPEKLLLYRQNQWTFITEPNEIYNLLVINVHRTLAEWGLEPRRIIFRDYYISLSKHSTFINHQPLIPLNRYRPEHDFDEFPIEIHFRYPPYTQSSFGEFVTNRKLAWRVWYDINDYRFSDHVGATDDLVYRLRHNLGHSLGLGHTESTNCIMYPTNIKNLYEFCPEEMTAMHALLFEKITERHHGFDPWSENRISRRRVRSDSELRRDHATHHRDPHRVHHYRYQVYSE